LYYSSFMNSHVAIQRMTDVIRRTSCPGGHLRIGAPGGTILDHRLADASLPAASTLGFPRWPGHFRPGADCRQIAGHLRLVRPDCCPACDCRVACAYLLP